MTKTITVKGIGRATAKPDYVVLSMALENRDMDYSRAMTDAARCLENLNKALTGIGFAEDDLKTTDFNVGTIYTSERNRAGNYETRFDGYAVRHRLKLAFDFDMARLSETLTALTGCLSNPNLDISFTVKDPAAISDEMLRSAASNARQKAQILCDAAGVRLGELLTIDYNWGELNIRSDTRYMMEEACLPTSTTTGISIEPDDIHVSDTATFVWAIGSDPHAEQSGDR